MTDLIQQRSNQLLLVASQLVKWRLPECNEYVSKDSRIKTHVWKVQSVVNQDFYYNNFKALQTTQKKVY